MGLCNRKLYIWFLFNRLITDKSECYCDKKVDNEYEKEQQKKAIRMYHQMDPSYTRHFGSHL